MAPRNKEIDSTFPITCSAAILEPRGRKPIFRVILGYFVQRRGGGYTGCAARNNGSLVVNDTGSRYRGKWIEITVKMIWFKVLSTGVVLSKQRCLNTWVFFSFHDEMDR